VNLSLILQLFVYDRWGRVRSAAQEWSRALKQDLNLSRARRPRGAGSRSLQGESLEVRQVLSSVSLTVTAIEPQSAGDFFSEAASPGGSDFPGSSDSDQEWLVQSLRKEFLAVLASSELQGPSFTAQVSGQVSGDLVEKESIPGFSGRLGFSEQTDTADVQSSEFELLLSDKLPLAETTLAGELQPAPSLKIDVALKWSEGPRRITVVELPDSSWQVTLVGLGGTSLAEADVSFTQQLVTMNAAEIVRSVQPETILQVSFQRSETPKESFIRFGSGSSSGASPSLPPAEQEILSRPIPPSLANRNGPPAASASFPLTGDAGNRFLLLDEVFQAASFFLDDNSFLSGMTASISGGGTALSGGPLSGGPVITGAVASRVLPADRAETQGVVSETEAAVTALPAIGKSSRLVRRGRISSIDLAGDLAVLARHLSLAELAVSPVDAINQPQSTVGISDTVHWLAQLMDPAGRMTETAGFGRDSDYFELRIRPTAVPLFHRDSVVARDRQISEHELRIQARRQRENQRQIVTYDAPQCLCAEQFESLMLPASGSIPRELRYVARPRGPPVYGRDADTPVGERDAPASLLERLRYSIAPRGPSLVAAEMQSPDVQSFSGPRVSPERFACQLAC